MGAGVCKFRLRYPLGATLASHYAPPLLWLSGYHATPCDLSWGSEVGIQSHSRYQLIQIAPFLLTESRLKPFSSGSSSVYFNGYALRPFQFGLARQGISTCIEHQLLPRANLRSTPSGGLLVARVSLPLRTSPVQKTDSGRLLALCCRIALFTPISQSSSFKEQYYKLFQASKYRLKLPPQISEDFGGAFIRFG